MAFEFKLSTDEIREEMFGFIKPVYKNTWDFEFGYINWIYGVYDSESGFFVTKVNSNSDYAKYILITGNGDIFYVVADSYMPKIYEISEELMQYSDIIQDGLKLYNNEKAKKSFESSLSAEQKKTLDEISENMKDRCRPGISINSYEDAEKLFDLENCNYHYISHMYNKNTVANFDKYMPDSKMRTIISEKYKAIISKICAYEEALDEENYNQISKDFQEAGYLIIRGIDDIYANMTFEAVKKAYFSGVISCGYTGFIVNYIKTCIQSFPDKIQDLRPILDFINENMRNENFKSLEFYRKELEKLIYQKTVGFQFVCTTDKLREKMFDYLKPEYKSVNDLDVSHINWITGVYDKESGIFLTKIYYVSDGIARCGIHYHSYIVITDSGSIFKVTNNDEFEKRRYDFRIPEQYKALTDKVKEGIEFYDNAAYEYKQLLGEDKGKKLRAIHDAMDDRCHKGFQINCEKDAKKLFELENFNKYIIFNIYNKKTINDFNKFADDDKMMLWRGDRYLQLLNEVTGHFISDQKRYRIFIDACNIFSRGVNDTYDRQFFNAVKSMYNNAYSTGFEDALKRYIDKYAEEYLNKLKNIVPLIEFAKEHTRNKYFKDTLEKYRTTTS